MSEAKRILAITLSFFGLAVPFSWPYLLVNASVFGLFTAANLENLDRKWQVSFLLLIATMYYLLLSSWSFNMRLFAISIFGFSFVFYHLFQKVRVNLAIIVLSLLCLGIIFTGISEGSQIRRELDTPLGRHYTTDMRAFIKTYQLMEQGQNFYPAFHQSMAWVMNNNFTVDVGGWREPFIFYFWKLLPGRGEVIYYVFEVFIILALISAYLINRKILPSTAALLAPIIIFPYFHYPLVDLTVLQVEWWGMFFFLFGMVFYLCRRNWLVGIFFLLSLLTREFYGLPILVVIMATFVKFGLRNTVNIFFPLLIFPAYYLGIHLPNVFLWHANVSRNLSSGSVSLFNYPLAYDSWSYLLGPKRPFLILTMLVTIAFFIKIWLKKMSFVVGVLYLSPTIFMTVIFLLAAFGGMDQWHDYWGIYFMPLVLAFAPAVILLPGKK